MKNIDEQIEEVTLHNKWFELTGIEISPEIAVFLRWAFKLIQKEREEAVRGFVEELLEIPVGENLGMGKLSKEEKTAIKGFKSYVAFGNGSTTNTGKISVDATTERGKDSLRALSKEQVQAPIIGYRVSEDETLEGFLEWLEKRQEEIIAYMFPKSGKTFEVGSISIVKQLIDTYRKEKNVPTSPSI